MHEAPSFRAAAAAPDPSGGTPSIDALAQSAPTSARRVIRTAELSLEAESPDVASQKLTVIADHAGGFVVSAETSRSGDREGAATTVTSVVMRVPVTTISTGLALSAGAVSSACAA